MNVMILAAGQGKRMLPLTEALPKPLLPVADATLIERLVQRLVAANFRSIVVNVARLGDMIVDHLGDGSRFGANIRFSNEGETPLETGGGIQRALPLLGEAPFLVVNADLWTDFPFQVLRERGLRGAELAHLVLVPNPPQHPYGDFVVEGELVVAAEQGQRRTFAGISVLSPELFASREAGSFALAGCLRPAIGAGRVSATFYSGQWLDIGTPERYESLASTVNGQA